MKKLIAMMLALVMVLSLCVACGGNTTTNNDPNNPNNPDPSEGPIKLTVGLPTKATELSYE